MEIVKNQSRNSSFDTVLRFTQARVEFLGITLMIWEGRGKTIGFRGIKAYFACYREYAAGLKCPTGFGFS